MSRAAAGGRARGARAIILVALAGLPAAACVGRFRHRGARDTETAAADTMPVVRVREFPGSAYITVTAWEPDDPQVGLRAEVRRDDGTLVGSQRQGDHALFLNATLVSHMGGFTHASVPPRARLLAAWRGVDEHACQGASGRHGSPAADCAPRQTVRLAVEDSVLRRPGDSLVVSFDSDWARPWTVALPRPLLDAYLHAVDSVAAARRARVGTR